jgi:PhoH-like ATPase
MKIVYILDTSVPVTEPRAPLILSEGNVVVIPFPLLEELDDLKSSSRDVAPYARQAIRVLDSLRSRGDLSKGVATPGGGVVIVDSKYVTPSDLIIQPNTPDNVIICTAYKWLQHVRRRQSQQPRPSRPPQQRRQKGEARKRDIVDLILDRFPATDVRIVSRDFNLRVKAASCGITAEDYQHDKAVKSEDEIYSGIIQIPVATGNFKEFSRLLCASGPAGTTLEDFDGLVAVPKLFPNQCCIFETEGGRNALAIYKDDDTTSRFVHVPKSQQQNGRGILPRNNEQAFAFALLRDPSITLVTLLGIAGSGKTLMALLAGIKAISPEEGGQQTSIQVYRPNVEIGEKMGFLPGSLDEKFEPWKRPVIDALELLANGAELTSKDSKSKKIFNVDSYLKQKINIEPINYIQGRSLHGKYIIVDETQNLRPSDVTAVITRIGKGAKIVLTGDIKQVANDYLDAASNGLTHVIQNMRGERIFGHITLQKSERSELAEIAAKRL